MLDDQSFGRGAVESTYSNLFKEPLVYGVSQLQLIAMFPLGIALQHVLSRMENGGLITLGSVFGLYALLRISAQHGRPGYAEPLIAVMDVTMAPQSPQVFAAGFIHPDTLTTQSALEYKCRTQRRLERLALGQEQVLCCNLTQDGDQYLSTLPKASSLLKQYPEIYHLIRLPLTTDPWFALSLTLKIIQSDCKGKDSDHLILLRFKTLDSTQSAQALERVRRRTALHDQVESLSAQAQTAFLDASQVAALLASGKERLFEVALVVAAKRPLDLDRTLFLRERFAFTRRLALRSVLGERRRYYRSHKVRSATLADFIPEFGDQKSVAKSSPVLFETRRGKPLQIDLQSGDLPALHINVSGTTGSGKSVATIALLSRLRESNVKLAAIFVDQLFSFRRPVRALGGQYLEPKALNELEGTLPELLANLENAGAFVGVELSELPSGDVGPAIRHLLQSILDFLKQRKSEHPIYIVMDESWRLLREEPALLQTLFRECRKLDGAAVAITQSLTDLLKDPQGQAVFQNSAIQLVLRQREDPVRIQGDLALNNKEAQVLRQLELKKGEYTELLVKLPSQSYLARLRLKPSEHDLFRTDTIRAERVRESRDSIHSEHGKLGTEATT